MSVPHQPCQLWNSPGQSQGETEVSQVEITYSVVEKGTVVASQQQIGSSFFIAYL